MKLYHTGLSEIREPDIHRGRKNADFGPGFYLTPDMDFAYRWAVDEAILNEYELDESGLLICRFDRDEDWFEYIFNNRRGRDSVTADVVIGPIANDTIFETYGIISSGYFEAADAMKLLMVGPAYTQAAIKTENALRNLKWLSARKITRPDDGQLRAEREEYDESLGVVLREIMGE